MVSRNPDEHHRVATPLELLFDLCFVVAVAQASSRLHHGLEAGHTLESVLGFVRVFFAIWWAWMNFSWFASAYDTDDAPYRLTVLVQIAGILVLAAGVPRGLDQANFVLITVGYVIMRVGLVAQWLRAAASDRPGRRTALRYAVGVTICQLGWIGLLFIPVELRLWGWLVLVPCELAVPIWAERAGRTPWHAHHIAERYGLMTIIVLGESVLSATLAIQSAFDAGASLAPTLEAAVGGLLVLFSMWWLYFDYPAHHLLRSMKVAFLWGYSHLLIFASAAAVGAGLAVAVDQVGGTAHVSARAAAASIAVPVAIYLLSVWLIHVRPHGRRMVDAVAYPITAGVVLVVAYLGGSVLWMGLTLATLVGVSVATCSEARSA
ncbi:MAG: low temperature requirement protein A [Polyangiaceae bacterium]|nr:low temperature requirement protein A [Polyangiaceae bacterium]